MQQIGFRSPDTAQKTPEAPRTYVPRKDRNLLLATLPVNWPSSNSASTKIMLYSLRWLSWVLQWSGHRSYQGDYSAYEKQPFKFQTVWSQVTQITHSTGTVCFQTIEFFQLTFHLVVQYKIFQDVAVKVQLVFNCTSSLGQTKAQKDFFFSSPHISSVLQRSSNWFTSSELDEFNPIGKSRTRGRSIYH